MSEASEWRALRELDQERTARQKSERAAEELRGELAAARSEARDAAPHACASSPPHSPPPGGPDRQRAASVARRRLHTASGAWRVACTWPRTSGTACHFMRNT
ncbi:hypothetical protein [Cupriavidus necator]